MSRKVLCPECGTVNRPGYTLVAKCTTCGKRLPFTMPRGLVYTLRTLAIPLIILTMAITAYVIAPQFKTYRQSLVVEKIHLKF